MWVSPFIVWLLPPFLCARWSHVPSLHHATLSIINKTGLLSLIPRLRASLSSSENHRILMRKKGVREREMRARKKESTCVDNLSQVQIQSLLKFTFLGSDRGDEDQRLILLLSSRDRNAYTPPPALSAETLNDILHSIQTSIYCFYTTCLSLYVFFSCFLMISFSAHTGLLPLPLESKSGASITVTL